MQKDETKRYRKWILNGVYYFVACNLDFGLAYAIASVAWLYFRMFKEKSYIYRLTNSLLETSHVSLYRRECHQGALALVEEEQAAIKTECSNAVHKIIESPHKIKPCRLWDLRSNRVINYRLLHAVLEVPSFWAISHSWTADMTKVYTPINEYLQMNVALWSLGKAWQGSFS